MGFFNRDVGIAVAVTALVTSPKARSWVRRGAVYGLASVLSARDKAQVVAAQAAVEAKNVAASSTEVVEEAKESAASSEAGESQASQQDDVRTTN